MIDGLTIERDRYRKWRVLFRGQLVSSGAGAMSWFRRKRDAQSFVNYLHFLFGERLAQEPILVSTEEVHAIERCINELGGGQ